MPPQKVSLDTETPLLTSVALESTLNVHIVLLFTHILIHPSVHSSKSQTLAEHLLHASLCAGTMGHINRTPFLLSKSCQSHGGS